jgi:hypothetical protein
MYIQTMEALAAQHGSPRSNNAPPLPLLTPWRWPAAIATYSTTQVPGTAARALISQHKPVHVLTATPLICTSCTHIPQQQSQLAALPLPLSLSLLDACVHC